MGECIVKKYWFGASLVVASLLGTAQPANASLILSATIDGINVCASDNNAACGFGIQLFDTNPLAGILSLDTTTLGGFTVEGSLHQQIVGPQNILDSSSLTVRNNTNSVLDALVAIGATDFAGPATTAYTSGSGTWQNAFGSQIDMNWYNDPLNRQGAENPFDTPGDLLRNYLAIANALPISSFSDNAGPFSVNDPQLFSMTLAFALQMQPNGSLISRGMNEIKPQDLAVVPEPATLVLMGTGLLVSAARARKLRKKQQ